MTIASQKLVIFCGGLALAATANAATISQIDFDDSSAPVVTQAGWSSVAAANNGSSQTLPGANPVITAGTTGYFQGRGSTPTWAGITGTSWNDMVDDCVAARGGNGTLSIAFSGLNDAMTYQLTVWHNVSATDSQSFAGGLYTITPSISAGTLVGTADNGAASNWDRLDTVTDASFDTTMIGFTPIGGTATVTLTSASVSNFLVMSGMQLDAVPEPSSAMLLGLGGLALLRRRCR